MSANACTLSVLVSNCIPRTVATISGPVARLLKQASDGLRLLEGPGICPHIMPVQHNAESHCLFINRQLPLSVVLYSAHATLRYQHGAPAHSQYHFCHLIYHQFTDWEIIEGKYPNLNGHQT